MMCGVVWCDVMGWDVMGCDGIVSSSLTLKSGFTNSRGGVRQPRALSSSTTRPQSSDST